MHRRRAMTRAARMRHAVAVVRQHINPSRERLLLAALFLLSYCKLIFFNLTSFLLTTFLFFFLTSFFDFSLDSPHPQPSL
jgi:hypothetical protein